MQKNRFLLGTMIALVSGIFIVSGIATADRDEHDEEHHGYSYASRGTLPSVKSQLYKTECGTCHFAYQPGWLPSRSWEKMMAELDSHFDDNAELSEESREKITGYLLSESADARPHRKSRKILRSIAANEAPQRISTLPYMEHKHDDIPSRFIQGNAKVGSLANCVACHRQAERGYFDDDGVNIPGYGLWDD